MLYIISNHVYKYIHVVIEGQFQQMFVEYLTNVEISMPTNIIYLHISLKNYLWKISTFSYK
jgi:hypothetical protein